MIQKGTDRDRFKEQKITPRLDSPIAAVSSDCENDYDEEMAVKKQLKLKELCNSQSSAENQTYQSIFNLQPSASNAHKNEQHKKNRITMPVN